MIPMRSECTFYLILIRGHLSSEVGVAGGRCVWDRLVGLSRRAGGLDS